MERKSANPAPGAAPDPAGEREKSRARVFAFQKGDLRGKKRKTQGGVWLGVCRIWCGWIGLFCGFGVVGAWRGKIVAGRGRDGVLAGLGGVVRCLAGSA